MADALRQLDWLPAFALDQVSELVIITEANLDDPGGARMVYVNHALTELTGYRAEELIGQSPRIFQGADTDKIALGRIKAALRAGEKVRETILNYARDGTPYWTQVNIAPVRDPSGTIVFFLSVQRNVTDERQAAETLKQTLSQAKILERHFANARIAAKIGIFDYSVREDLQYWSDELLDMTGLGNQPFPAPSEAFISGIDWADRPAFDAAFGRAVEHGESYSIRVRFHRPDRRVMHMQIIAEVREVDGDRRIIGIARDVSDEVEASDLLEREKERFQIIADTVSDVLWDYEVDNDTWWVSPDWPQKLGLSVEATGFSPLRWVDHVAEEDREEAEQSLLTALRSGQPRWRWEFRVMDLDGSKVDVEINATLLRRDDGWVYRLLGNIRNVTSEKRQREGFTRSRALEAVGKMTGGIAHDFNNLLMIIQGNAEALELSNLDEDDRESVEMITQASYSAASLTARLLSFAGQTKLSSTAVNLSETIAKLVPLLRSALTNAIELRTRIAGDVQDVKVDATALEQAIVNLAVNARDAMPNGGTVEIACENCTFSDEMMGGTLTLLAGRYVCISVTDTGTGMSEDVITKACEPFFTTKDVGKGTGLGLSTVYGFTRQSGGGLQIYSELGQGTTVSLYLPISEAGQPADHGPEDQEAVAGPTGSRILVVEDQPNLRRHVEKLLRRSGYDVITAPDGTSALAMLESIENIDILFTDVIMPGGVNGVQLAEAAEKLLPGLRVLFTSGFPASAFTEVGITTRRDISLLKKPYRSSELLQKLNDILTG